ncbi:hypothetical protein GQ457_16G014400 [Hibiscus cannabinus]
MKGYAIWPKESLWRQKYQASWLCLGDMNTTFSHRTTKVQAAHNVIVGLIIDGRCELDIDKLRGYVVKEFRRHFAREDREGIWAVGVSSSCWMSVWQIQWCLHSWWRRFVR